MDKGAAYWMDLHHFDDEDPIFLAQVQRGITNFVKILTGKDIPVEYATSGDSMTDGETVYIASNLKEDTIDYTVGLALHEASHVLLTDFAYLNKERGKVLETKWSIPKEDVDNVFTLINFVEDKRIDHYVYSTAPGYQYYYEELYRKSFYNQIVDDNLKTDNFTTPTWDAYFFRIINIFNRNSNLDKLPGLREVRDLLTYNQINKLKSTQDSIKTATKIYNIIKHYIQEEKEEDGEDKPLNNQEYKTREQVERQKNFINSQYRKKRVHKKVKEQVNKLANSDTKINNYSLSQSTSIPTLITKDWEEYFTGPFGHNEEAVTKGLFLGKQLLKKLKVRNTVKKDIFENQKKGKLNSSKLYQASFNENLFYRIEKEDYKNIFIHISLDLSGSMRGEKLAQTIQTAVAIAYAACNIKGFDVEISLRGTVDPNKSKSMHSSNQVPILAYAFNSKKDSIKKLQKFKKLITCGMTPEGICLDQIRKNLPAPSYYKEVYLVNISDGLPNISSALYNFSTAINHTAKVVNEYKKDNIGLLSYFIHDTWDKTQKAEETFKIMYGKSAKYIDINNVSLVANTINNLLLSNTIKVF
tara:strand:- start:282 stop:2033 length:1752 start_codon:yes stop_codon:yes gene_type:complete